MRSLSMPRDVRPSNDTPFMPSNEWRNLPVCLHIISIALVHYYCIVKNISVILILYGNQEISCSCYCLMGFMSNIGHILYFNHL
jgi:hypothetical protein